MVEMKNCPTCGALLTARQVNAMANNSRTDSCPKAKKIQMTNTQEKK